MDFKNIKDKLDPDLIEKYVPDKLSVDKIIYSHYECMEQIKKLTEANENTNKEFDKYKQRVRAQS